MRSDSVSVLVELVGLLAGLLTIISALPQFIKTLKTRRVRDLSFFMYLILDIGLVLWLVYGVLINSFPLIIANAFALILDSSILLMIIIYHPKGQKFW